LDQSATGDFAQLEAFAPDDLSAAAGIGHRPAESAGNKRDVPYQSLLKVLLTERLKQEEVASRS